MYVKCNQYIIGGVSGVFNEHVIGMSWCGVTSAEVLKASSSPELSLGILPCYHVLHRQRRPLAFSLRL
jgi:hypothetical protein